MKRSPKRSETYEMNWNSDKAQIKVRNDNRFNAFGLPSTATDFMGVADQNLTTYFDPLAVTRNRVITKDWKKYPTTNDVALYARESSAYGMANSELIQHKVNEDIRNNARSKVQYGSYANDLLHSHYQVSNQNDRLDIGVIDPTKHGALIDSRMLEVTAEKPFMYYGERVRVAKNLLDDPETRDKQLRQQESNKAIFKSAIGDRYNEHNMGYHTRPLFGADEVYDYDERITRDSRIEKEDKRQIKSDGMIERIANAVNNAVEWVNSKFENTSKRIHLEKPSTLRFDGLELSKKEPIEISSPSILRDGIRSHSNRKRIEHYRRKYDLNRDFNSDLGRQANDLAKTTVIESREEKQKQLSHNTMRNLRIDSKIFDVV
jgi:hypothetical protein